MDEDEILDHAERIGTEILSDIEYCYIYEDPELEDASEEDWRAIHAAVQRLLAVRGPNA